MEEAEQGEIFNEGGVRENKERVRKREEKKTKKTGSCRILTKTEERDKRETHWKKIEKMIGMKKE